VPQKGLWEKVYQSIKQGGHLLSFFGSRTYHRGVIPIEDAGFEIRDQLMWLYGSGFPKSHNIGKSVDKLQGNERKEYIDKDFLKRNPNKNDDGIYKSGLKDGDDASIRTKGTSEYEGWGTALKPAHEPIVMARKPFKGSVAENVLEHGTGGINIDSCRVGKNGGTTKKEYLDKDSKTVYGDGLNGSFGVPIDKGRFPANVMHDGSDVVQDIFGDKSRYFYCAKASKKDRDEGLEQLETPTENLQGLDTRGRTLVRDDGTKTLVERWKPSSERKNNHPTVKPTELMRYLCRLVTPKGGVVLDPFMGSGSTGKGALLEGFRFIGIEMEREYFDIACARLEAVQKNVQEGLFDEH
jgi:site-specific DNA-methyltransferase (adenine-specific)